jgi:predicted transcriptional regulator
MALYDDKLKAAAEQLKNGVSPQAEYLRSFLAWFGAERRGYRVVNDIRRALDRYKLSTSPDFEYAYIDGYIKFVKAKQDGLDDSVDPTVRLSRLDAANRAPVSVAPDTSLQEATTLMLTKDYSQLPVMTGTRDVKGLVSWRSVGSRLALRRPCATARECMDDVPVIPADEPLLAAIAVIVARDCVLVQAPDKTICGIVTAADLSDQFRLLAEPYLLIGEIERGVRHILHGKFSAKELQEARMPGDDRQVTSVSDLSFGEYVRLIQEENRWKRLGVEIDRVEFCKGLERIRELRNDVMHFDPGGPEPADIGFLNEYATFLRRLRSMGAV